MNTYISDDLWLSSDCTRSSRLDRERRRRGHFEQRESVDLVAWESMSGWICFAREKLLACHLGVNQRDLPERRVASLECDEHDSPRNDPESLCCVWHGSRCPFHPWTVFARDWPLPTVLSANRARDHVQRTSEHQPRSLSSLQLCPIENERETSNQIHPVSRNSRKKRERKREEQEEEIRFSPTQKRKNNLSRFSSDGIEIRLSIQPRERV